MDVYEIKIKLYLLKDIKIEETQTYLAYFIDSVMVKDNMFLGIHETNQYKFYTFDSLYPLAKNGVYQKDNSYMFRIRTLDYQLAQYLYDTLAKNRTKEFQGLTAEVKIIKPKLIKKIYTLTPVILKTEQGYWKNSIKTEDFEKRLKTNLIKKYKDIIKLLGDMIELEIAENDNAQKLAFLAIGSGLLEMNARGFGFVNYIYY